MIRLHMLKRTTLILSHYPNQIIQKIMRTSPNQCPWIREWNFFAPILLNIAQFDQFIIMLSLMRFQDLRTLPTLSILINRLTSKRH